MSYCTLLCPSCSTVAKTFTHPDVQLVLEARDEDGLDALSSPLGNDVERGGGMLGLLVPEEAREGSEGESLEQDKGEEAVLRS